MNLLLGFHRSFANRRVFVEKLFPDCGIEAQWPESWLVLEFASGSNSSASRALTRGHIVHVLCSWAKYTEGASLHVTQVYKWIRANLILRGNPATSIPPSLRKVEMFRSFISHG